LAPCWGLENSARFAATRTGCLNPTLRKELLELSYWTMQNPRNDSYYKDGQPTAEILAALAPGEDPTVETAPPGTGWHVKNAWNRRPEFLKYATPRNA